MRRPSWFAPGATICLALVSPIIAGAADPDPAALDLAFYRSGETFVRPTITLEVAAFSESNAWLGESRSMIGDHVGRWNEYAVTPGLEGAFALGDSGVLFARGSAVGAGSFGLDAAGSDSTDHFPERLEVEDLYVGWRSGALFPSLGKDAVELSYGKQKYQIGNGFFMSDGASDGGHRGAFWIGPRKAFYTSAIARLHTGPYKVEAFYLKPNDEPYTSTKVVGGNFEYETGEAGVLGVSYLKIYDSARPARDGMDYFDWRADLTPIPADRAFHLSGEWAQELNGHSQNSSAWYAEAGHAFDDASCKPFVSYRYSWFQGDNPHTNSDVEIWDPLFYGQSDWSTWYVGEIIGGFVALNRDLAMQTLRLRGQASDAVTLSLIYNYYSLLDEASEIVARDLNPRAANITRKHIGQEFDFVTDWTANDHLSFSGVVAAFDPGAGSKQYIDTNSSSWWLHFMLYAKLSF